VVLAFGGRHSYAVENLSAMVPKRLAKNAKLHRELAAGLAKSGGNSIPLDHLRVDKLFKMIAKALAWYHWRVRLGKGHSAVASTFHDAGELFFDQMLTKMNTPDRVSVDLGDGTFAYQGVHPDTNFPSSPWGSNVATVSSPSPAPVPTASTKQEHKHDDNQNRFCTHYEVLLMGCL
jgi:hypothetical protein